MRALIANKPAIYREVFSSALKELRPDMEIFTSEPDDLEGEFLHILPHFVVCSRPKKLVEGEAPAWVELYPDGPSHAVVKSLDGSRRTPSRVWTSIRCSPSWPASRALNSGSWRISLAREF